MLRDILLFTTEALTAAVAPEVRSLQGRVTHELTPTVLVARVPDDFDSRALQTATSDAPPELDDLSQLMVKSWHAMEQKVEAKSKKPPEAPIKWNFKRREEARYM